MLPPTASARLLHRCLLTALIATLPWASHAAPADTARTAAWFDAHQQRPTLVRQFVQRLPKGADLHSHLSGAVYAESYLAWAAAAGYCAQLSPRDLIKPPCDTSPGVVRVSDLSAADRAALVDRMSTRNLGFAGRSGHDQFFDSFRIFGKAGDAPDANVNMLIEVTERAASQHIQHLELMTTLQGKPVRELGTRLAQAASPAALTWRDDTELQRHRAWLLDNGMRDQLPLGRQALDQLDTAYAQRQACGQAQPQAGCAVSVRWLQQTSRTGPPAQVFAQLVYAFEIAAADARVVGINLVAPEDDAVALRDYSLHMRMIGFLARQHPQVRIALHAGELTLGLVPPNELRFHIREAVEVAGAHRIGHAVALGYENDAAGLLQRMKARDVAAEICLTSNEVILGVKGADHPLPDYLAAGVPVVLASDDEGVSRIDLSHEYQRAAQSYGLGYRQLKQLSRNSLSYSFLPGESLWRDAAQARPALACAGDTLGAPRPSARCQTFLQGSAKAQRQWALEGEFNTFETLPTWRLKGGWRSPGPRSR